MPNFYPAFSPASSKLLNRFSATPALIVFGALLPIFLSQGHAATLGDITFDSKVGEHLQANIPIYDVDQAALSTMEVIIADDSLSKAAGLKQSNDLPFLWAELRQIEGAAPVVVLLSGKPMPDKYNEIIVELTWSGGSYLREYVVQPPVAGASALTQAGSATQPSSPSTNVKAGDGSGTLSVTVKRGDTLLSIARELELPGATESGGFTMQQLMLSIYQTNPGAFLGSPNRLRAGAELSIPDATVVRRAPQQEAAALFKRPIPAPTSAPAPTTQQRSIAPTDAAPVVTPVQSADFVPNPESVEVSSDAVSTDAAEQLSVTEINTLIDGAISVKLEPIDNNLTDLNRQISGFDQTLSAINRSISDQNETVRSIESRLGTLETPPPESVVQPVESVDQPLSVNLQSEQSDLPVNESLWSKISNSAYLRSLGLLALALALAFFLVVRQVLARRRSVAALKPASDSIERSSSTIARATDGSGKEFDHNHRVAEADSAMLWFKRHLISNKVSDAALLKALARHPQRQDIRLRLLQRYAKRRDVLRFTELGREMYLISRGRNPEWSDTLQLALSLESDMQVTDSDSEHMLAGDLTSVIQEPVSTPTDPQRSTRVQTDVELM